MLGQSPRAAGGGLERRDALILRRRGNRRASVF